jgi:hypothetical protein
MFPTDTLGLEPVGYRGVLLSAPLHAFLSVPPFANVHVQLANKKGF